MARTFKAKKPGDKKNRKGKKVENTTALGYKKPAGNFREVSIPYVPETELENKFNQLPERKVIESQLQNLPQLKEAHYDPQTDQLYENKRHRRNFGIPVHGTMPFIKNFIKLGIGMSQGIKKKPLPWIDVPIKNATWGKIDNKLWKGAVGTLAEAHLWAVQPQLSARWLNKSMINNKRGNFHNLNRGDKSKYGHTLIQVNGKDWDWWRGKKKNPDKKGAGWKLWWPKDEKAQKKRWQKAGKNWKYKYSDPIEDDKADQYLESNPNLKKYVEKQKQTKYFEDIENQYQDGGKVKGNTPKPKRTHEVLIGLPWYKSEHK